MELERTVKDVRTNVSKMVVVPYQDKTFQRKSSIPPYYLPVNPESYSQNYKIEVDRQQGQGNQGTNPNFKSTAPEELRVEFLLDGTGTIEGYYNPKQENVLDQFKHFKQVVYYMEGNIHRPNFLVIFWGELSFPCILTNLDINYTLFSPDGKPLRAKISATFLNYIAQEERVARENKRSPDLTHIREVKADDRLDLMTYRIYNQSQYVLQIAKANQLTSLRSIEPGQRLVFPPLDKTEL